MKKTAEEMLEGAFPIVSYGTTILYSHVHDDYKNKLIEAMQEYASQSHPTLTEAEINKAAEKAYIEHIEEQSGVDLFSDGSIKAVQWLQNYQTLPLGTIDTSSWVRIDSDILPPFDKKLEIILENGERHLGYFNGADNKGEYFFCDNNDYHYPTHWKLLSPAPDQASQPNPAIAVIEAEIKILGLKSSEPLHFLQCKYKIEALESILKQIKG